MPGPNQVIQGFQDTVTMTAPVSVYPMFQVARRINLATVPAGLQVLADRAPVPTPVTMEWGWDSTHSVGAISPQQDITGHWWVFSSWSDGGAANHAYQVAELIAADSLTATFVPAAPILLTTSPPGLSLTVDGKSNWPTYNFTWGVGETHTLQAPAQQTDAQGRIWAFASWSNGGPATQSFTVPASAAGTGVRLVATYNPVGHLTVTSSMPGLTVTVNGANCATPCDIQRPVGTQVRVSAPASVPLGDGTRADLSGWSGSVAGAGRRLGGDSERRPGGHQRELPDHEPSFDRRQPGGQRVMERAARLARRLLRLPDDGQRERHGAARLSFPRMERRPERIGSFRRGGYEHAAFGDGAVRRRCRTSLPRACKMARAPRRSRESPRDR